MIVDAEYFDRQGNPITSGRQRALHKDEAYRVVGLDAVGPNEVSTVWVGMPMECGEPPMIFETLVFGGNYPDFSEHYATEAEAIAGHARIVGNLKSGLSPDA